MEDVRISAVAKVSWHLHLLTRAFRAASMNGHLSVAVWLLHFERDHHGRDDFVGDLGCFSHIAGDNVDAVPRARLDIFIRVHVLLHEEAGIEAVLVSVVEVD